MGVSVSKADKEEKLKNDSIKFFSAITNKAFFLSLFNNYIEEDVL